LAGAADQPRDAFGDLVAVDPSPTRDDRLYPPPGHDDRRDEGGVPVTPAAGAGLDPGDAELPLAQTAP
jgi:hypothetical protein